MITKRNETESVFCTGVRQLQVLAFVCVFVSLATQPARCAPRTKQQQRVDAAIVKALEFLADQQETNGAWKVNSLGESTAATSLAVMAFMAAGHVPAEGPYADHLDRGIAWVVDHQQPDGMIVHRKSHGPLYSHGISTLMLAETVGMTQEPLATQSRQALARAVHLILKAQDVPKEKQHAGGWRYQPTSRDSDLSVSGWQLLALRAAKNVGCDVPAQHIDRAVAYVKACSTAPQPPISEGARGFAYQPGGDPTPTRTGTGILALEICGAHRTPEAIAGAEYLLQKPLKATDHFFYYGAYYCCVGMFKVGGHYWENTRDQIVDILLEKQSSDGSWSAAYGGELSAGEVYTTCMAVLALAVEYQYLPIYQR